MWQGGRVEIEIEIKIWEADMLGGGDRDETRFGGGVVVVGGRLGSMACHLVLQKVSFLLSRKQ